MFFVIELLYFVVMSFNVVSHLFETSRKFHNQMPTVLPICFKSDEGNFLS